jgi:hypothetical protein
MNSKKTLLIVAAAAFAMTGCNLVGAAQDATLKISARLATAASRSVDAGDIVTTISSYKVMFKKVEIGNSEVDKFTLWESASPDGEEMDIVDAVSFIGVRAVTEGTYKYLRFTIGTTLNVDGSIDDAGTVYAGSGSETLTEDSYLFGVDIPNGLGEATITAAIEVVDGAALALVFDVDGTVTYLSGTSDAAVLSVEKPVITVVSE